MSGLKRNKNNKKEIKFDEWTAGGEYTVQEIRPDAGIVHSRYITDRIVVLNYTTNRPEVQERAILEQKVVWPDGKEHLLPRTLR